jgi:DNA-directed RNA polymerase specialized sigma24 family protein
MAAQAEFTAALDRLVEHDYVRLVRAVALFSGTMEGAEDAVQEALAWALEHSRKGRHIDCLEAWVVSTAFDHLRTRFRRAARRRDGGMGLTPRPVGTRCRGARFAAARPPGGGSVVAPEATPDRCHALLPGSIHQLDRRRAGHR